MPKYRLLSIIIIFGAGYRCGATCVDDHFLHRFLPERLGPENYHRLLTMGEPNAPGGGSHVALRRGEKIMLKKFEPIKHKFAGSPSPDQPVGDDVIDLPEVIGVQDNPANRILNGQLFISW